MSNSKIPQIVKIGERVINLRLLLDLDTVQLCKFLKMDKKTLNGIEVGNGYHIANLEKVSTFFMMEITDLTDTKRSLPDKKEFQKSIYAYHLKHGLDIQTELKKPPTLAYVITVVLVNSGFFNAPKSVKEVREHIVQNYKHLKDVKGFSQALLNAEEAGILKIRKKNIANSKEEGSKNNLYYVETPRYPR